MKRTEAGSLLVLTIFLAVVSSINQFLAGVGWLNLVWALLALFGWGAVLGRIGWHIVRESWQHEQVLTRWLLALVIGVWLTLSLGIFVPETAFDAVWYHLPVAKAVAEHGGLVYLPNLYQSLNPLATDLFFVLGWLVAGGVGTKIVAFLWFITLQVVVFSLGRKIVSLQWSLLIMTQVALFQVVAWQSTSFYVDLGKAVWELLFVNTLLWLGQNKTKLSWWQLVLLGVLLGNSVATKQFSLVLVPVALWGVWWLYKSWSPVLVSMIGVLVAASGFYIFAWWQVGTPFFSLLIHTQKIVEIGQGTSLVEHLKYQLLRLPVSWWFLLTSREYVSPLVFGGILFGGYTAYTKLKTNVPTFWWVFAGWQWLMWWFIPPVSTRYAVAGFIVLTLLGGVALEYFSKKFHRELLAHLFIVAICLVMWVPRLYVISQNWPVLTGQQSHPEYIESKYDGWIDQHLQNWYGSAVAE